MPSDPKAALRIKPDPFTLAIVGAVLLASVLPGGGSARPALGLSTELGVTLLFFFHGARLSREAVLAGLSHYRLHAVVLCSTFLFFPLLGLALSPLGQPLLGQPLYAGLLFLCVVPSTVQSSIAFTAIARGNVAAAVCSASASSILGIVLTPLLVQLLGVSASEQPISAAGIWSVVRQLLLPFIVGHLARRWLREWVERRRALLSLLDKAVILLVVYAAFSAAVLSGLWQQVPPAALLSLLVLVSGLLGLSLFATWRFSRWLGFSREDEIVVVFCGSKKSLASGVPLATALFPAAAVGAMVLPLMLYHQLQLFACTVIAQRYARRVSGPATEALNSGA